MSQGFDPSKRAFLRGRQQKTVEPPQLPWIKADLFYDHCTRCAECQKACEEQVITLPKGPLGDKAYPSVNFDLGECTFCGACAAACPENLFDREKTPAWPFKAIVQDDCLTYKEVICQSCKEACDSRAIQFPPKAGQVAHPLVQLADCTGCGACRPVCPVGAIEIALPSSPQQN